MSESRAIMKEVGGMTEAGNVTTILPEAEILSLRDEVAYHRQRSLLLRNDNVLLQRKIGEMGEELDALKTKLMDDEG